MQKLRKKENRRIGYYAFEFRLLGNKSLLDESFIFSISDEQNQLSATKYGEFAIFNADLLKNSYKAEKYFVKAIKTDPKNSFWIGNYAIFLHFYKKDIQTAEKFYKLSLKLYNQDPFLLFNYFILKVFEKKEYDVAEKLITKAIEYDPDNVKFECTYAGFLYKIKKDDKKAEELFTEALKKYSNNPQCLANYAQYMILKKEYVVAENIIDRAFELDLTDDVRLELWFYRYAHYHKWEEKAEFEMNKLIKQGVKTSAWGFQLNVVLAIFSGHNYPDKLEEFGKKIEGFYKI